MSRRKWIHVGLLAAITLLALGVVVTTIYTATLPRLSSQHETIVLGQEYFLPGERAALRLVVRDSRDASPLQGATVRISMQPQAGGQAFELYSGQTDAGGTAEVTFTVPKDAAEGQTLRIETHTPLGSDSVERTVSVERTARVLLTTDKPVYQPGQVMHLRALALDDFNHQAAGGQMLEFSVTDGKGNKVFRQQVTTSEFGVASADFTLASEVNVGNYKIEAALGKTTSEKTVEVKRYILPKYAITLQPEKTYYLPGEHVRVALNAAYFYGKPVDEAQVTVSGYTFDVERHDSFTQAGQTDEAGNFAFEFDMPDFLAGSELEDGLGRFYIEASLTDKAAQQESSNLSLPVAQQALVIKAMPESGVLRQGLDNILYVLVSYPDGTPADCTVSVTDGVKPSTNAATGPGGMAVLHLTPDEATQSLRISAHTSQGITANIEYTPGMGAAGASVLLRPDKPVYDVGETMKLNIFSTSPSATAYLDIVKGKQTMSTRAVEVKDGQVEVPVDVTPDLAGTLELHAYVILPNGNYVRDTRLVVVNQSDELQVTLQPQCAADQRSEGSCVFKPGDPVGLDIQVSEGKGAGVRAALGLAIVDESVFAVADQDPGFERLYFLLEQGLLEPKYDIHGYALTNMVSGEQPPEGTDAAALGQAIQGAAFASLAAPLAQEGRFSLQANSHVDVLQQVEKEQNTQFGWQASLYGYACGLLALAATIVSIVVLARRRRFWISVGGVFLTWVVLYALFNLLLLLSNLPRAFQIMEIMVYCLLGALGLSYAIGLLAVVVRAIVQRDTLLGWAIGLVPLYTLFFLFFIYTLTNTSQGTTLAAIAAVLSLLVMVHTYLALMIGAGALKPLIKAPPILPILLLGALLLSNCSGAAPFSLPILGGVGAPPPVEQKTGTKDEAQTAAPGAEAPRLRQYFPETLLWLPDAVTQADGALHVDFSAADSITTWRMSALASTTDGQIGSTTAPLRVFQDFFIDLDLPLALTVGDEVAIPVGVFNYLGQAQTVRLEVQPAGWFELLDDPVKEINIEANDIQVVYFRIKAGQFGLQPFQVTAWGSKLSDAVLKHVQVYPNGALQSFSQSGYLSADTPVLLPVIYPTGTVTGTQALVVKIYPGVLSQVVDGLEGLLRMPSGCFEQTSSATYPNVLVLDYLKSTGKIAPEVQFTAEGYINQGYQRLVTFEVGSSGGFSLFGNPPADRMLTAYGLQEFADMSRVHPVDQALLDRAAAWLLEEQAEDGSWENDRGLVHESSWGGLQNDRLPVTAYIAWSLTAAGYADRPGTQKALQYVAAHQQEAEADYVLAIVANALVAGDLASSREISPGTEDVLDRLAAAAQHDQEMVFWPSQVQTYMGGSGSTADVETTAMAALALMRSGRRSDLSNGALVYLAHQKDEFGSWYSTLSTVMALKALIESTRGGSALADAQVTILLNGQAVGSVKVNAQNYDVVQLVSLNDLPLGQENTLELRMQGEGSLTYQVVGNYYLPWALLPPEPAGKEPAELRVIYDRSQLAVGETVKVDVRFAPTDPQATISSAMVEIGLPPGFSAVTEDLDTLVAAGAPDPAQPKIERYELAGRNLLVYVSNVSAEYPLTFSFHLRARFPLRAQTAPSSGYDYYNPQLSAEQAPDIVEVK